jgi:hypothetical protein
MPRVHAVAYGFRVYSVALCGLIAMRLSIPGVGLFTLRYRSIKGVLDFVAFRRVRRRANFGSQQSAEGDNNQSAY